MKKLMSKNRDFLDILQKFQKICIKSQKSVPQLYPKFMPRLRWRFVMMLFDMLLRDLKKVKNYGFIDQFMVKFLGPKKVLGFWSFGFFEVLRLLGFWDFWGFETFEVLRLLGFWDIWGFETFGVLGFLVITKNLWSTTIFEIFDILALFLLFLK